MDIPGIFSGTFYESISDNELLQIEYVLKKDGKSIIERKEKHWWLTGFDVGIVSEANQLSLEIQITFPNYDMQKAFIEGLYYAGYNLDDINIIDRMVQVDFTSPKTKQPQKYNKIYLAFIQIINKLSCNLFKWITKDFTRTIDKIDFLRIYYPILFRIIANSKRTKKLNKLYKDIQSYINK